MTQPGIGGTKVFLPVVPMGTDQVQWYAFSLDTSGHLQVDVLSSALPAGGASAANQLTMITALQLIDDLRGALAMVADDSLRVNLITAPKNVTDIEQLGADIKQATGVVTAANGAWTTIVSFTVTTGKTAYILGFNIGCVTWGTAYEYKLRAATVTKVYGGAAGSDIGTFPPVLFRALSTNVVDLQVIQWTGANRGFGGTIFYVEY